MTILADSRRICVGVGRVQEVAVIPRVGLGVTLITWQRRLVMRSRLGLWGNRAECLSVAIFARRCRSRVNIVPHTKTVCTGRDGIGMAGSTIFRGRHVSRKLHSRRGNSNKGY